MSELLPDGAATVFPNSYAAACFETTSVELHRDPGPFEGLSYRAAAENYKQFQVALDANL